MTYSTRANSIRSGSFRASRAAFWTGAAALALISPAMALAQGANEAQPAADAAAEEDYSGNEIVVTATKREQTLQEVPIAVSVTTQETIERAQIRDLKDLSSIVPSLRINTLQSSANTNFIIRGFGNGANNAGIEPSVGVFVDGVYRSRSAAQIGDLADVQRVEVLRGPQSTLFGKNASAGVISMTTQAPKFTFGGNVEASYGNYNAMVIKGVVTGPLSETVAASFAAGYNKRDGYNNVVNTGGKTNERDRWFVRGQLLFQGDSGLKVRIIGDYGKIDENCCGVVNLKIGSATQALVALGARVNTPDQKFDKNVYESFASTNNIDNYGISGQIDYEMGPLNFTSITAYRGVKAVTNQDSDFSSADLLGRNFQDLRIKTFTQEFRVSANLVDKINALAGVFYFNEKIDQANQVGWGTTARAFANLLTQGASGGALNIQLLENTFGALEGAPTRYQNLFFASGQGFNETYRLKNEAISIFAQVDFELADRLTLTGGINYTNDKKNWSTNVVSNDVFAAVNFDAPQYAPFRNQLLYQGALAQQVGAALGLGRNATAPEIGGFAANPATNAIFNAINAGSLAFAAGNQNNPAANPLNGLKPLQFFPQFVNLPNAVEPGRLNAGNVSYTARLAFQASDQINVYASVATGYKAASVNLSRDARPTVADRTALIAAGRGVPNLGTGTRFAEPERTTVYEGGFKGNWPWGSINAAVFYQAIKGFQSNTFIGTGFTLINAGKQSTWGQEIEATLKPTKGLTIGLSATFLQPKYDDFKLSAFGDASGTTPAGIPKFSGTVSLQYEHELNGGDELIFRTDFHHESKVQIVEGLPNHVTTLNGVRNLQAGLDAAKPFTRGVDELNASLTYVMQNGLELTIWGRNITDNRYISTIFDTPAQQFSVSGYPNQPRTFGGSVRFRF